MQVRELNVRNFRGVQSMDWRPSVNFVCIIGSGDSGKSTVLDAIEATLSHKWTSFTDADFPGCDTTKSIEIKATVGELSKDALRDTRFGLFVRGWSKAGVLNDEPAGDDEPVVTVRLTVDASLAPVWELVTDRGPSKVLSAKDRMLFGVIRLGAEVERHLAWGHGSALSRLSEERDQATPLLANAYRVAREQLSLASLPALTEAAARVRQEAKRLGAYPGKVYGAGLDAARGLSLGAVGLHSDGVPIRLAGLGTRRLVALAVQNLSVADGAIILIDELEHGLEPHRIRHALRVLRTSVSSPQEGAHVGQVLLTTHSAISVVELACSQLGVLRTDGKRVQIRSPGPVLQAMVRRVPEAFLARCVIVCEGKTEVGLLRGLRDLWAKRHDDEPLESRGVAIANGGGTEAPATAIDFARLGYRVLLLRDSDLPLPEGEKAALQTAGVPVVEWPESVATEERILRDISDAGVQRVLEVAYECHGDRSVLDAVAAHVGSQNQLATRFLDWVVPGKTRAEFRAAIATIAKGKTHALFKRQDTGERLGALVAEEIRTTPTSPLAQILAQVECWAYA